MGKKGIMTALVLAGLLVALYGAGPFAREATLNEKMNESGSAETFAIKEHHRAVTRDGTDCALCHGTPQPTCPPDDDTCLACHGGYEQVARLTAHLENNPHDSPHYGTTAACTACHSEHRPSEAICSSCHLFRFENLK
jgi:hypothetical protein